jgi:hypothetical protein
MFIELFEGLLRTRGPPKGWPRDVHFDQSDARCGRCCVSIAYSIVGLVHCHEKLSLTQKGGPDLASSRSFRCDAEHRFAVTPRPDTVSLSLRAESLSMTFQQYVKRTSSAALIE